MTIAQIYEEAERKLDKNEITIGEFSKIVDREYKEPKVGEWLEKEVISDKVIEEWQSARCSVCDRYHTTPYMYYFSHYDYCPNCGAEMEESNQALSKNQSSLNQAEEDTDTFILKRNPELMDTKVLDEIKAEIEAARFIDKDTKLCKNANASGLEVALEIIDKYRKEAET